MILELTIRNYILIRDLKMALAPGFNVVTGETGAGKSILLGALGLLMGDKARYDIFFDQEEKCVVEGLVDVSKYQLRSFFHTHDLDYAEQLFLRRELLPQGRSRAFVNDVPVSLEVLKKLGQLLLDIHSQHDTQRLTNHSFQRQLIDTYANNASCVSSYRSSYHSFQALEKQHQALLQQSTKDREEEEYTKFLCDELDKAAFTSEEQTRLEDQVGLLSRAAEIKETLQSVLHLLQTEESGEVSGEGVGGAALARLRASQRRLHALSEFSSSFKLLSERLNALVVELDDICQELVRQEQGVEENQEQARQLQERLDLLYELLRKHKASDAAQLFEKHQALRERLGQTVHQAEQLRLLEEQKNQQRQDMVQHATALSQRRQEAMHHFAQSVQQQVRSLGMPSAVLQAVREEQPPDFSGIDRVDLLFSANRGIEPRSLAQVASGGELSRLMLVFKHMLAQKVALPSLLFDEIDSGISGEIARKMADMMRVMSSNHQVIAISHLPIFASQAQRHFSVSKREDSESRRTKTYMRRLSDEERVMEIAHMMEGKNPSQHAIEGARALLRK